MAQSFARSIGDKWLDDAVRAVPNMHSSRKRDRQSLEPAELLKVLKKMREAGNGHLTQHVWNLACLGVRPDEYCQPSPSTPSAIEWLPDAVRVVRGKTLSARRFVPRFAGVKQAQNFICTSTARRGRVSEGNEGKQQYYSLSTLRKAFTEACDGKYELYDLRSTSQKWMEWCGISDRALRQFAGHSRTVSEGYRTNGPTYRDWKRDITTARKKMRRFFEREGIVKRTLSRDIDRLEKKIARLTGQLEDSRRQLARGVRQTSAQR